MVVVGIVGVLSAVALPNLLSNKDRAEAQTTVGALRAFADQCNNNQQTENPSTITVPTTITDTMTNDVCGTFNASGLFVPPTGTTTFTNTTKFAKPASLGGIRCGVDATGTPQLADGSTHNKCTFSVPSGGGQVTGAWSVAT